MGSATRGATAAARSALATAGASVDGTVAEELFFAGRTIGSSLQLRTLLGEPAGDVATKRAALEAVLGSRLSATSLGLLQTVVSSRWSSMDDLLGGIEELGLRATAISAPSADLVGELFAFEATVTSNPELELAIGSKLGQPAAKASLVDSLFSASFSPATLVVIRHLVQQPRGRRIGGLVKDATTTIADESGAVIATVSTAAPLDDAQQRNLQGALTAKYGRNVKLNLLVDPALIGGVRIAIGDDIIDGSVATRIADLRLQLAG